MNGMKKMRGGMMIEFLKALGILSLILILIMINTLLVIVIIKIIQGAKETREDRDA